MFTMPQTPLPDSARRRRLLAAGIASAAPPSSRGAGARAAAPRGASTRSAVRAQRASAPAARLRLCAAQIWHRPLLFLDGHWCSFENPSVRSAVPRCVRFNRFVKSVRFTIGLGTMPSARVRVAKNATSFFFDQTVYRFTETSPPTNITSRLRPQEHGSSASCSSL